MAQSNMLGFAAAAAPIQLKVTVFYPRLYDNHSSFPHRHYGPRRSKIYDIDPRKTTLPHQF
jgi:hypothetical protein